MIIGFRIQHTTLMDESSDSLKRSSSEVEPSIHEPSAKRAQVVTLQVVPDDLSDATHAIMDEAVLDVVEEQPVNLGRATFLLATIVSSSQGRLDAKYRETPAAKALLQEHPALMEKLTEAWAAGTFRQIRNLSSLT
jgi:hypothetical protein